MDHDELRGHLSRLKRLERLALSRDTYLETIFEPEKYYSYQVASPQMRYDARTRPGLDYPGGTAIYHESDDDPMADNGPHLGEHEEHFRSLNAGEVWELGYRNRMITHVEKYAVAIPSLEWMVCGELPMEIVRGDWGIVANPLAGELDTCFTMLNRMFGMGDLVD